MFIAYLKIIKKYINIILIISILIAVMTYIFTARQPVYYNSSLSLLISGTQVQDTNDYRFDGYYTIQATDLFGGTVVAWLKSPEVVTSIYEQAKVDIDKTNIKNLTKIFKAEKLAPHYVEVRYKTSRENDAERIAEAITQVLAQKTLSLGELSKKQTDFYVNSGDPVIALVKPPVLVNTLLGLVIGALAGILLGIVKEYFKRDRSTS